MNKIRIGRVIGGGIAAGVVMNLIDFAINTYLLKTQFDAVNQARNIAPMSSTGLIDVLLLDFAMAIVLVFTYAAIRPRFGAGPRTALIASLLVAASTSLLSGYFAATGFFPWGVWARASLTSTGNFVISGLVGAAVYSE